MILDRDLFDEFLDDAAAEGADRVALRRTALDAAAHHGNPKRVRAIDGYALESRWYASLARGEPDYGVYADDAYLADLWACWKVYSRKYLLSLRKIADRLPRPRDLILDLGCGLGYTTAALREIFGAPAVGTNLPGLRQTAIAARVGSRYGFAVADGSSLPRADLVFASEFFEHLPDPLTYLARVEACNPSLLVVANTFGSPSIGHFPTYSGGLDGRATSRAFGRTLREFGFEPVETGFWNNRPAVWLRA